MGFQSQGPFFGFERGLGLYHHFRRGTKGVRAIFTWPEDLKAWGRILKDGLTTIRVFEKCKIGQGKMSIFFPRKTK